MRRWVSLLLLIMLPLQSNWAALSAFCQHEQGVQAHHIGHHLHQHSDSDEVAEASDPQQSHKHTTSIHGDCSSCLITLLSLPVQDSFLVVLNRFRLAPEQTPPNTLFRPATPPERPDRALAVPLAA